MLSEETQRKLRVNGMWDVNSDKFDCMESVGRPVVGAIIAFLLLMAIAGASIATYKFAQPNDVGATTESSHE